MVTQLQPDVRAYLHGAEVIKANQGLCGITLMILKLCAEVIRMHKDIIMRQ